MNEDAKKIEEISRERVRYIIDNFCDGNRMEFSRRTGIGKSSISQYVNGTNAPGSITAAKIGEAFHLDPMWVMGFDVEEASFKERQKKRISAYAYSLMSIVNGMNDDGIKRLIQYAEDIQDKYRKE